MISEIYKPIDDESAKSLGRLNNLLESEIFLAGLGYRCSDFPIGSDFPVVKDIQRAHYLMSSQEMWDETQPTDEKYFVGVVEDSVDRYLHYGSDEPKRTKQYSDKMDEFSIFFRTKILSIISDQNIIDYVHEKQAGSLSKKEVEQYIVEEFAYEMEAYLISLILGSYCGGLEIWPVANHMAICFETGGMPCGWIGPEYEDGGTPQQCMQVMHFG